jgi:lipid II:glycine glycyltransferase (peptidoglycan interpeptide bridge formation enzyme)
MSGSDYKIEIDKVDKIGWNEILRNFDDANIYQTWSYGAIRWGEKKLSHLVLKKGQEVVAATQTWIFKLPAVGLGIAHIKWGPMWQVRGKLAHPEIIQQIIRSLKKEYAISRGLVLRVVPNQVGPDLETIFSLLEAEGFKERPPASSYRTLALDLSPSLDELRKGLRRQWRQKLEQAERNGLKVIEGQGRDSFEGLLNLYDQMHSRKKFADFLPIRDYQAIQGDLPEDFRMKIMICESANEPIAFQVTSFMGNSAVTLAAAVGDRGMEFNSGHLLQWRMVEDLKSCGCRWYDLSGINREGNPGGYQFKTGLAYKYGRELLFKEYEISKNFISSAAVKSGERLRVVHRRLKQLLAHWRQKLS